MSGKLLFFLHAHQPYVRHLEYSRFLEEDWFFEAMSESYLPMIRMLEKIADDRVPVKLVISLSPTLITLMRDEAMQTRLMEYMRRHEELGLKEVERTRSEDTEHHEMAKWYLDNYRKDIDQFVKCDRNILEQFLDLEKRGVVELITSCATYSYLPLYEEYPVAVNAQIDLGLNTYLDSFGHLSRGFWLPDCGYYPGLESEIANKGVNWFQTASHSMLFSPDHVTSGVYRPVRTPNGLAVFPLNHKITQLIWSAGDGYPGNENYREFYRDIGYYLPMEYIAPYIDPTGTRVFTGFKYSAVTGNGSTKRPYCFKAADRVVEQHAKNFLYHVDRENSRAASLMGREAVTNVGIDFELFGHWWFEGIKWLDKVLRQAADSGVEVTTPTEVLKEEQELQVVRPAFSSWGDGGYSSTWLNGSNVWIYRHIDEAIQRMSELAVRFPDQSSLKQRFLNQAAREMVLAMASDWPFILYHQSGVEYATRRIRGHLENFNVVYSNMCKNAVNTEWLVKAERRDQIFPDIDYNVFNPKR